MKILDRRSSETAREYAFRIIKNNIVSLEFVPGTFVSENEIASSLGLSRTPVREAIIDLAKDYVIETIPQRGNLVTLIDLELVEEARFLRQVLDKAVIELACKSKNSEDIVKLEENVQLQEFYLEKKAYEKLYELDDLFHETIYLMAKKTGIYEMRSNMMIHFDRVRTLSVEAVDESQRVKDHKDMLEAIKNQDVKKAVELVDVHMDRFLVDKDLIRDKHPEYFKA